MEMLADGVKKAIVEKWERSGKKDLEWVLFGQFLDKEFKFLHSVFFFYYSRVFKEIREQLVALEFTDILERKVLVVLMELMVAMELMALKEFLDIQVNNIYF